jgi:hypothetical protein
MLLSRKEELLVVLSLSYTQNLDFKHRLCVGGRGDKHTDWVFQSRKVGPGRPVAKGVMIGIHSSSKSWYNRVTGRQYLTRDWCVILLRAWSVILWGEATRLPIYHSLKSDFCHKGNQLHETRLRRRFLVIAIVTLCTGIGGWVNFCIDQRRCGMGTQLLGKICLRCRQRNQQDVVDIPAGLVSAVLQYFGTIEWYTQLL